MFLHKNLIILDRVGIQDILVFQDTVAIQVFLATQVIVG